MTRMSEPMPTNKSRPSHNPRRKRRTDLVTLLLALAVTAYLCAAPAAILAIEIYQNHISPYNNHRCPHGLLHGEETCSQFGKRVISERGLCCGLWMLRDRFDECREAHRILQEHPETAKAGFCCFSCGDEVHACEW